MAQMEIKHEQDLAKVAPKDSALYEDIPLTSLTAYSLFWLHRWQLRRSIEAVAVLNWRLFPKKFAMVGFAEYPDAFRTNRSLLQGQPKYRNLLSGAASKGFSLNERGMDIARDLVDLGRYDCDRTAAPGSGEPRRTLSFRVSRTFCTGVEPFAAFCFLSSSRISVSRSSVAI